MPIKYAGRHFEIRYTDDAEDTGKKIFSKQRRDTCAQMDRLIRRLADEGSLRSPDQLANEGEAIYAIKCRSGLRAYCWFSKRYPKTVFISHFILKKKTKLERSDLERACKNRTLIEEKFNG